MMTRKIVFLGIFVVIIAAYLLLGGNSAQRISKNPSSAAESPRADSKDRYHNDIENLNRYWLHIHAAREYMDANNYDKSKIEYEEAIKASRSNGDVWMARALIKDMYVKSGQTDHAVNEIDWLYQHNPRSDVRQELSLERSRLLAAKSQSFQNQPSQSS